MTVHKHPIPHHWIHQTLIPFLLYTFSSTLPHPANISAQIQQSIAFCLLKPDYPSDGDDLVFERVFMAIVHRHENLALELETVVENLETLARYLIRRVQVKEPFELLGRGDVGSWERVECERRSESWEVGEEEGKDELVSPMRYPTSMPKLPPAEEEIDPRLVHAQQGHLAAVDWPIQLTVEENSYYRRQNRGFEERQERRLRQQIYEPSMQARANTSSYDMDGVINNSGTSAYENPYQHQPQMLPTLSLIPPQHAQQQTLQSTHRLSQQQYTQLQSTYSDVSSDVAFRQPYSHQSQPAHFQEAPAQHAESPHQQIQTPAQQQPPAPPLHRINQYQLNHSRNLQYTSPLYLSSPAIPVPFSCDPPTSHHPATIPIAEFPHLRDTDWSPAAARCGTDIVAKISAEERDELAKGIMQRQAALRVEGVSRKAGGIGRKLTSPGLGD